MKKEKNIQSSVKFKMYLSFRRIFWKQHFELIKNFMSPFIKTLTVNKRQSEHSCHMVSKCSPLYREADVVQRDRYTVVTEYIREIAVELSEQSNRFFSCDLTRLIYRAYYFFDFHP